MTFDPHSLSMFRLRTFAILVAGLAWLTLVAAATAEELRLEPRGVEGSELVVDVVGSNLHKVGGFDLTVRFDPGQLGAPTRANGPLAAGTMFADNGRRPGEYRLALLSPTGVSGAGEIATLRFPLRGDGGATALQLDAALVDVRGAPIETRALGTQIAAMPVREVPEPSPEAETLDTGEPESEADAAGRPETAEVEPVEPGESERAADEAPSEGGALESDPDEAPLSPEEERRVRDRAARMAGYQLRVIFDPGDQVVARPRTELNAEITVFHRGRPIPISSGDLSIATRGVEVKRIRFQDDDEAPFAIAELSVDPEALPAEIEVAGFDLYGRYRLPVHPEIDPDLDGSGRLDDADIAMIEDAIGSRKGSQGYAERVDLVPDGVIDGSDLAAFRFNLIQQERARRLRALEDAEAVLEE